MVKAFDFFFFSFVVVAVSYCLFVAFIVIQVALAMVQGNHLPTPVQPRPIYFLLLFPGRPARLASATVHLGLKRNRKALEGCQLFGKSDLGVAPFVVSNSGDNKDWHFYFSFQKKQKKKNNNQSKLTGEWLGYRKSINCAIRDTCGIKTGSELRVWLSPLQIPIDPKSHWLRTNAQRYIWKWGKWTAGKTQPSSSSLAVSSWTMRQCGCPFEWRPLLELVTHWESKDARVRMCWLGKRNAKKKNCQRRLWNFDQTPYKMFSPTKIDLNDSWLTLMQLCYVIDIIYSFISIFFLANVLA